LRERLERLGSRIRDVVASPAFAQDVLNSQRELAGTAADYQLPAQPKPAWFSTALRARVVRRDRGYAVAFEGGEIALGAAYPTIEWMLQQRMFSLEDAIARQPHVNRQELQSDFMRLVEAGVFVETEMR
jgi:hypothetical protein